MALEQGAQLRIVLGGKVGDLFELVMGQHMRFGRRAGCAGEAADVHGGQAVPPAQQLLLGGYGQRVGAVKHAQRLQIVQVVHVEGPGDVAQYVLNAEGWRWLPGRVGLGE